MQYLPIEGLAAFIKVTAELLFGADNPVIKQQRVRKKLELDYILALNDEVFWGKLVKNEIYFLFIYAFDVVQVATVQGLSGTGSLRLAAALIERYFPGAKVLISSPTWG